MNGNYYAPKTPAESKRILLVEEDPNFGTVLKEYLLMRGLDVALAKKAREGYEKFKK